MDEVEMQIIWMPTFRCNLSCSFCIARALPHALHGTDLMIRSDGEGGHVYYCPRHPEVVRSAPGACPYCAVTPAEWIDYFNTCPLPIRRVAITGGEPTCFPGLGEILAATDFTFTMDSNLRLDPARWLKPDMAGRVEAINCGLQFQPDHPEAQVYWQHLAWLRTQLPETQLVCSQMLLWREDHEEYRRIAEARCEELGVEHRPITFDDTFLYKDALPLVPGRRVCDGGYSFIITLPDTALFRCLGQTYFAAHLEDVACLGKLRESGWESLRRESTVCEYLLCTTCDQCNKTATYFED